MRRGINVEFASQKTCGETSFAENFADGAIAADPTDAEGATLHRATRSGEAVRRKKLLIKRPGIN
jgi:hypothetical protein